MSFDSLLPLTFNVREVEVLARSASIDGLLQNNGSCYCELMPAVGSPTAAAGYEFLFHSEIDPPTEYFKEIKFDEVLLFKLEARMCCRLSELSFQPTGTSLRLLRRKAYA